MTLGTNEHAWALEAVAHIDEAVMVVDTRVAIVYQNEAAAKMMGLEELGDPRAWTPALGVFRPDRVTLLTMDELPLVIALRTGLPQRDVAMFARTRSRPEGFHVVGNSIPLLDEKGKIRGAAVLFRDVTAMMMREAQLRESERQKKAILDSIPDIAWLKDREGHYIAVNQPFLDFIHREHIEDALGLTDHELWPKDIADGYRAADLQVMATGEPSLIEEQLADVMTGKRSWIETVKKRIVDDDGTVLGTAGIAHDITARKRAQEELERRVEDRTAELRKAQENLVRQERLAVLGQLAGGVAHQIRNPLAAIMNATYVLQRHHSVEAHANVLPAIRIIQDEVRHANIIITGLLDYARVRTPDRHPTSVVDILERLVRSDWIPENVKVRCHLPEGDAVILVVDADQLSGAISNLVRNAVDAMPDGGELEVVLRREPNDIVITVSDSGTGIAPQVRGHLFEPLHSTKPMGIGLGLVTARRFVEAHGGTINVRPVPTGASFEVRIPSR